MSAAPPPPDPSTPVHYPKCGWTGTLAETVDVPQALVACPKCGAPVEKTGG